jgi:hypothetical protein
MLVHHCETCPVRLHLFEKRYGELKEKRQDLAALAMQLREEMGAAGTTLEAIGRIMLATDFGENLPKREMVKKLFGQVSDIERGIGILRFQMMLDDLL